MIMTNKKFLVLGSAGQIGTPLVEFLRSKGHQVLTHDIKDCWTEDLRLSGTVSREILKEKILRSDFVFFLAWDVGGSKYLKKNEFTFEFIDNNIQIMHNVFLALEGTKKPFIFTSSQMAGMLYSPYGNTKLIGEKYTKVLNGVSVRLWNVFGFEEEEEKRHVITDFIFQAAHNGVVRSLTTGKEKRQFLYIQDCCEVFYLLVKNYEMFAGGNSVHISSFKWVSIEEVAQIVSGIFGCQFELGVQHDSVQLSEINVINPEDHILQHWQPKHSIEEGINCIIKKMRDLKII